MIGELLTDLTSRRSSAGLPAASLLGTRQFNQEIARERLRAARHALPFCVLQLSILGTRRARRQTRIMTRLLSRNLRMTDQKAITGKRAFGVLLVDTPASGGRVVMRRIADLAATRGIKLKMELKVYQPEDTGMKDTGTKDTGTKDFGPDDFGSGNFDSDDFVSGGRKPIKGLVRPDLAEPVGALSLADSLAVDGLPISGCSAAAASPEPRASFSKFSMTLKRTVDIVGASVGLLLTSPLIAVAVLSIRRQDGHPAIFKQTREGKNGKPFTIYKLRTMIIDAESTQDQLRKRSHRDGPAFKISHDPRVTKIGQILRSTCIDELPQLVNVLKGEMSLVGPRPLPLHESRACRRWHRRRLDVRPGMTCYWQVNKKNVKSFDEWMRLDLRYLDQFNLYEDLRLIAKTVTVPLLGRGSE